jgi:predicted membrane chloride channel (bestrophin family)
MVLKRSDSVVVTPLANVLRQHIFWYSLKFAIPSAVLAFLLHHLDHDYEYDFIQVVIPDKVVLTTFFGTISMLMVFRTVHALNAYRAGAGSLFSMVGSWYDCACTLITFTRQSTAEPETLENFKHTLVRLFSLLNMYCLAALENAGEEENTRSMDFNMIDIESLDNETLQDISESDCKAEVVCQKIQCLVVDNLSNGVVAVPAALLSRVLQDLGAGMVKFHETKNLSHVPLPFALQVVTEILLLVHTIFAPFLLAHLCASHISAAGFTLMLVFTYISLNCIACEVENPFNGDLNDINTRALHDELNVCLVSLVNLSGKRTPSVFKGTQFKPILSKPSRKSLANRSDKSCSPVEPPLANRSGKSLATYANGTSCNTEIKADFMQSMQEKAEAVEEHIQRSSFNSVQFVNTSSVMSSRCALESPFMMDKESLKHIDEFDGNGKPLNGSPDICESFTVNAVVAIGHSKTASSPRNASVVAIGHSKTASSPRNASIVAIGHSKTASSPRSASIIMQTSSHQEVHTSPIRSHEETAMTRHAEEEDKICLNL